MGYQILNLEHKDQWNEVLAKANNYDFYHTWEYNSLTQDGDPFLFLFRENDDFIAFPLIKRKIQNSNFFDLTSAYGYVGPISSKKFGKADDQFLDHMKQNFLRFMNDHQIVSLFSRLHPIMTQPAILNKFGGVFLNGKTVLIDLGQPLEEQRQNYRKAHAKAIQVLREKEFYCKELSNQQGVEIFVSIYHENMRRIKALPEYFFDEDYFHTLLGSKQFATRIILVYLKDEPVAGGVFTFTNDVIQVHLLSTRTQFLQLSPLKLLIDEVSVIGRAENVKYMHLGGGYGGKEDSLFAWKAGFSNSYLDFHTWRYINSNDVYNDLVADAVQGSEISDPDYFPLYRKSLVE